MTPKEKAEELINKFNPVSRIYPTFVEGEFVLTNDAKECALIAVDEIINELADLDSSCNPKDEETFIYVEDCMRDFIDYWQEVKQEIEKL